MSSAPDDSDGTPDDAGFLDRVIRSGSRFADRLASPGEMEGGADTGGGPEPSRDVDPIDPGTFERGIDRVTGTVGSGVDKAQGVVGGAIGSVSEGLDDLRSGPSEVERTEPLNPDAPIDPVVEYGGSVKRRVRAGSTKTSDMVLSPKQSEKASRNLKESYKDPSWGDRVMAGGEAIATVGSDVGKQVRETLPLEDVGPKVAGTIRATPTTGVPGIPGTEFEGTRPEPVELGTVGGDEPQTVGQAAEGVAAMIPAGIGVLAGQTAQAPVAAGGVARQAVEQPRKTGQQLENLTKRGVSRQGEYAQKKPAEVAGLLALPYAPKAARSVTPKGRIGSRVRTLGSERVGKMAREAVEKGEIQYPSYSKRIRAPEEYTRLQDVADFPVEASRSRNPVTELQRLTREFTPERLQQPDSFLTKQVVEKTKSSKPGSEGFRFKEGRSYDTEGGFVGGDLFLDIKGAASKGGAGGGLPRPIGTGAAKAAGKGIKELGRNVRESGVRGGVKKSAAQAKEAATSKVAQARKSPSVVGTRVRDIRRMPDRIETQAQAEAFLREAPNDIAWVRSPSRIRAEAEGIIPARSEWVRTDSGYRTRARGMDIPVEVFEPASTVGRRVANNPRTLSRSKLLEVADKITDEGRTKVELNRLSQEELVNLVEESGGARRLSNQELVELAKEATGKETVSQREVARRTREGEAAIRAAQRELRPSGSAPPVGVNETTGAETFGGRRTEARPEGRPRTDVGAEVGTTEAARMFESMERRMGERAEFGRRGRGGERARREGGRRPGERQPQREDRRRDERRGDRPPGRRPTTDDRGRTDITSTRDRRDRPTDDDTTRRGRIPPPDEGRRTPGTPPPPPEIPVDIPEIPTDIPPTDEPTERILRRDREEDDEIFAEPWGEVWGTEWLNPVLDAPGVRQLNPFEVGDTRAEGYVDAVNDMPSGGTGAEQGQAFGDEMFDENPFERF